MGTIKHDEAARDPRVDPRPGDAVRLASGMRHVVVMRSGYVVRWCFDADELDAHGLSSTQSSYEDSLGAWVRECADAEIVKVASCYDPADLEKRKVTP